MTSNRFQWLGRNPPSLELERQSEKLSIYGVVSDATGLDPSTLNFDSFIADPNNFAKGDFCYVITTDKKIVLGASRSGVEALYFRLMDRKLVASDLMHDVISASSENKLSVDRGVNGTTITSHVSGSAILGITEQDNNLIEVGDDFGFSGGFS